MSPSRDKAATDSRGRRTDATPPHRLLALKIELLERLPQSLDPAIVLQTFLRIAGGELPLVSIALENQGQLWESGAPARHRQNYRLELPEEFLGELQLSTHRRLQPVELSLLESLMGCLLWPLRNALQHREALEMALHDRLTGCGNRVALDLSLEREIALAQRHGLHLSLMLLDVDHFKAVNDNHGHGAGDTVLCGIAAMSRQHCRESDNVFRYGGEEFVVLLPQTPLSGACRIAERLREVLAAKLWPTGIRVTASFGLAELKAGEDAHSLFKRADAALYSAKRSGRNRVICTP